VIQLLFTARGKEAEQVTAVKSVDKMPLDVLLRPS
jgi:hypothetical protein